MLAKKLANALFDFVSRSKWGFMGVKTVFFAVFVFFRIYGVFFDESCPKFDESWVFFNAS
jgi:hypothetical protein